MRSLAEGFRGRMVLAGLEPHNKSRFAFRCLPYRNYGSLTKCKARPYHIES